MLVAIALFSALIDERLSHASYHHQLLGITAD